MDDRRVKYRPIAPEGKRYEPNGDREHARRVRQMVKIEARKAPPPPVKKKEA